MKKIFLTSILLFIFLPFIVKAEDKDIEIKSVEPVDISIHTIEKEPPVIEETKIKFNLKFLQLNDYAKYKIVIKNSSLDDYKINKESFIEEQHIKYTFEYVEEDKNTNQEETNEIIIKAGTEKKINITISYTIQVEDNEFINSSYNSSNAMKLEFINLSDNKKEVEKENEVINESTSEEKNPNTKDAIFVGIVIMICSIILLILLYMNNKTIIYIFILFALLIPTFSKAENSIKIDLISSIEIEKTGILRVECDVSHFIGLFKIGTTFYEYSQYYDLWSYDINAWEKDEEGNYPFECGPVAMGETSDLFETCNHVIISLTDENNNPVTAEDVIKENTQYTCKFIRHGIGGGTSGE